MKRLLQLFRRRKTARRTATPQQEDHEAHAYLGHMYLALGKTAEAETEYALAYAISPSENGQRQLAAIRALRAQEKRAARNRVILAKAA